MDCNRSHVSKNSSLSSHLLPGTEPLLGTPVWTTHFPWVTSHERNNQCLHLLSSHSFLNLEEVGSVLVLCSSHSFQERSRFLYCQSSEDTYCPHLTWHIIMKQITKLLPKLLNTSFLKHSPPLVSQTAQALNFLPTSAAISQSPLLDDPILHKLLGMKCPGAHALNPFSINSYSLCNPTKSTEAQMHIFSSRMAVCKMRPTVTLSFPFYVWIFTIVLIIQRCFIHYVCRRT